MTTDQIGTMLDRLARIETRMDDIAEIKDDIRAIRHDCPTHRAMMADHGARLNNLEKQQLPEIERNVETLFSRLWWGVGLVVAAVVGFVIEHVLGRK